LISAFVVCAMCIGVGIAISNLDRGSVPAQTANNINQFMWLNNGNGTSTVLAIEVSSIDPRSILHMSIPANGPYGPVTMIGSSAFSSGNLITATIPNTVTLIGDRAFFDNQLTSVTIPNSATHIGESAFANNNLTNLRIPEGVQFIDDLAFADNSLERVTLPGSLTTLGAGVFQGNNIESIYIPGSVFSISENLFAFGNTNIVIYTSHIGKPEGWHEEWLDHVDNPTVTWGTRPSEAVTVSFLDYGFNIIDHGTSMQISRGDDFIIISFTSLYHQILHVNANDTTVDYGDGLYVDDGRVFIEILELLEHSGEFRINLIDPRYPLDIYIFLQ